MKQILQMENFVLWERQSISGWHNLKLTHSGPLPKTNWWLAWNGTRLARNADAGKLENHHPEIYAALEVALKELIK